MTSSAPRPRRRSRHLSSRRPVQHRGSETVQALRDAAQRLLRRREFHRLSVADLARSAGVGVGTFYHFFPSKDALLLDLREAVYQRTMEELAERLGQPIGNGTGLKTALEQLLEGWVALAKKSRGLELAIVARSAVDPAFARALRDQERATEARVAETLRAFKSQLRSIDFDATARLFVILVDAVVIRAMREPELGADPGSVLRELARMMARHLLPPAAGRRSGE